MYKPADICNQALDAIGSPMSIGDLEEGSRESQVLLRHYGPILRKLLRSVHWDFARAQVPLELLADATLQNTSVPSVVQRPWSYCYAYPTDCVKARFVPMACPSPSGVPSGNTSLAVSVPLTAVSTCTGNQNTRLIPARFLIATDPNFPPPPGQEWWAIQGVAPNSRTVVLTNVKHAHLVYTKYQPYPSLWDPSFRDAFVALLASEVALALTPDKKFGLQMRNVQIAVAKEKIMAARISDGNEGHYTVNREASWIATRNTGA